MQRMRESLALCQVHVHACTMSSAELILRVGQSAAAPLQWPW